MPKCEKSSKQNPEQATGSDYPNKGKLGDMGPDPRMGGFAQLTAKYVSNQPHITKPVKARPMVKKNAAIAVQMALSPYGLLKAATR